MTSQNFLDDAPFTAEGKLQAVANGVCLHTGRVIAMAVKEATHMTDEEFERRLRSERLED